MRVKKLSAVLLFLFLVLPAASGFAADEDRITMDLSAYKQVTEKVDGKEVVRHVPLDLASPGDIIRYEISYANISAEDVYGFAIVDPLPRGVSFVAAGKAPTGIETIFSIDGGGTYHAAPVYYESVDKDGNKVKKEATPDMYTHITWKFTEPIAAGAKGAVSFDARVK